jgi:tubulin-specific chaperone A
MAPPSKLTIATSVLQRLVKEEASYHKEALQQEARIAKLQEPSEDENAEYQLKQEVCITPTPRNIVGHWHTLNHD